MDDTEQMAIIYDTKEKYRCKNCGKWFVVEYVGYPSYSVDLCPKCSEQIAERRGELIL